MGKIDRITVHHEGYRPVYFSDMASTAERLELIRQSHLSRMRAGDIGYHYVIDRAGRLWECRDFHYQGAHVKNNNEHNLGVMVLGNFDRQQPTDAQIVTLRDTLSKLMRHYRVPVNRVYTHQEITPTACPGKKLQPTVVSLRTNHKLA
ncbi:MAG: peptidoglycan recognition family protein [Phycisphaeraceae bacterium]